MLISTSQQMSFRRFGLRFRIGCNANTSLRLKSTNSNDYTNFKFIRPFSTSPSSYEPPKPAKKTNGNGEFRRVDSFEDTEGNEEARSKKLSEYLEDRRKKSMTSYFKERRDYLELWNRKSFGYISGGMLVAPLAGIIGYDMSIAWLTPGLLFTYMGIKDISTGKTLRKNFPVIVRMRYLFESFRPEIRQYFHESDSDEVPMSREQRNLVVRRSKDLGESLPFGTRKKVYETDYEFLTHSNLGALHIIDLDDAARTWVGVQESSSVMNQYNRTVTRMPDNIGMEIGQSRTKSEDLVETESQGGENPNAVSVTPYNMSRLNISAMSYGALSHAAVKSLNWGAKMGNFYHNTGEGGFSRHHRYAHADVVWNIGTGYFGCRDPTSPTKPIFSEQKFLETLEEQKTIKMIELKLSQGAKPGHGGILPRDKISDEIAAIRGVSKDYDVVSPPWHSSFTGPKGLVEFLLRLRRLSKKPVGFKMCVGNQLELACIVKALQESFDRGEVPCDFITIDGGEGGTGAAPLEFSNYVGTPLKDAIILTDDLLRGAGIRHRVKIICSGKITDGFSMVRSIALGADCCNAARAFMLSLGCIQARKCNSNHCPTGITTQDELLIAGLDIPTKALRVKQYQKNTLISFSELIGALGCHKPEELNRSHVMVRTRAKTIQSYEELFPTVQNGILLTGKGPEKIQGLWDKATV